MRSLYFLVFFAILFTACSFPDHYFTAQPDCVSSEHFVGMESVDSEVYQTTARTILIDKSPTDFRYFFNTFQEEGSKTYMVTNFRNDELCFDVKVYVDKWDKLEGMRRVNGKAYPKELYDLKWKLAEIDGQMEVHYQDMHDIID